MKRILLVRHDKIGDFVLTWPAFYLVRAAFPDARIEVLVAPGLESFARLCPYIDDVITDGDDAAVTATLVERQYDAAIALHSPWRICKIFRDARVPYTLGPKHRWYQYLYKDRASARYRKGEPCWRGNCMIVEHFIRRHGRDIRAMPSRLWDNSAERDHWGAFYGQHGDERLIFVHAGTGGSSGSLPPEGFVDLLKTIDESTSIHMKVLLTYSGDEQSLAAELARRLRTEGVTAELANPLDDLADFARSLVAADLFIAGSTGPIHLAGLHDVPTVGFYAGRRSRPDIRWQTLTQPGKRLSFTPPIGRRTGRNMALVDTRKAGSEVAELLDELYS
ncbi:MAG: glycosyltransferase family 9 protein [Woeseiaceae bacterium]